MMLTPEEEKKKREIFEAMSPRRKERILKKGYENWNPFLKPKDPLEQIKRENSNLIQALKLSYRFFSEKKIKNYSNAYIQGVNEICLGIARNDDRYQGIYDFCCWYKEKKDEND